MDITFIYMEKIELHKTGLWYWKNLINYSNWIDVKILLPELWERVLCFDNWSQYVARLEEWWWYKYSVYVEYPTHWMYLPPNP